MNRHLKLGVASVALIAAGSMPFSVSNLVTLTPQAQAQKVSVGIDIFFDELAPHGRWLRTARYGYVWCPDEVDDGWRPYTIGHWEYTSLYGWVWVSDEPFGWATYHYGRWGYDDGYGWFWVPGNTWAPAWVTWHYDDDYIGWAPLPPSGSGYAFSVSIDSVDVGFGAWRFVPTRYFLARDVHTHIVSPDRNDELLRRTRRAGHVRVRDGRVVNDVIPVRTIERYTERKVVEREVRERDRPGKPRFGGRDDDALEVYKPRLAREKPDREPKSARQAEDLRDRSSSVDAKARARGRGQAAEAREDRREAQDRDEQDKAVREERQRGATSERPDSDRTGDDRRDRADRDDRDRDEAREPRDRVGRTDDEGERARRAGQARERADDTDRRGSAERGRDKDDRDKDDDESSRRDRADTPKGERSRQAQPSPEPGREKREGKSGSVSRGLGDIEDGKGDARRSRPGPSRDFQGPRGRDDRGADRGPPGPSREMRGGPPGAERGASGPSPQMRGGRSPGERSAGGFGGPGAGGSSTERGPAARAERGPSPGDRPPGAGRRGGPDRGE